MGKTRSGSADAAPEQPSPKPQNNFTKWMTRIVALLLLGATFTWLDGNKEPKFLHELAQEAVLVSPNDPQGMITHILTNLTSTYPQLDSPAISLNMNASEWVFSNAGGAMGAITSLFSVPPLGTEGHTGLHTADDYFHILVGEQWAFKPGALEMERYGPGDMHFLPRGTAKQYKMHEGCFALEYARGWIPLMMPFGLADTFTSTLDLPTLYHTVRITGREMIKNLLVGKI
ncbi:ERG2 and Sigma1 receptor like protein-domain-containing protein [Suillus subalutaceus]|uniref:ERG2 and Sigma1 receptor like protein-domain-containing protein n=1 Tax=Suillus subalutaceus TaxID=48586 RepID=UPI001B85BD50|nr:ERG2 and Sigma1 receptor like protein-domain-containing protein [Suillus subalutaceus]KAG1862771.1 ERG2 and Sigma1 receptor like protein-domain-containing protein [Suillus subalutaceus]